MDKLREFLRSDHEAQGIWRIWPGILRLLSLLAERNRTLNSNDEEL